MNPVLQPSAFRGEGFEPLLSQTAGELYKIWILFHVLSASSLRNERGRWLLDLCIVHKTSTRFSCERFFCLSALFPAEKGRRLETAANSPSTWSSNPVSRSESLQNIHSCEGPILGIEKAETAWSTRACLKIGDVSSSEGFWAAGKQFFCRNPGGFQGKIAPSRGQKTRRLGMLTFFKQALGFPPSISKLFRLSGRDG